MNTIPQKPTVEAIPCRWKHLRGEGHRAIFRATCGRATCPGHLGDLRYNGSFAEEAAEAEEEVQRERRELERAVASGQSTPDVAALLMRETEVALEEARRLRDFEEAVGVRAPGDWCMQACWVVHGNGRTPLYNEPIYYGHADKGYRISHRGKRSRRGTRVGRRPDVRPALPTSLLADFDDPRGVDGQDVRPPACIWCPVCGTLNRLDWPEQLRDSQSP